jgi:cysteine desulfurase
MDFLNLDHNATTPTHPAALEAMQRLIADGLGNPASAHTLGRKARQHLEDAREKIAHLLDAKPGEVIFTSGATESNNLALFGQVPATPSVIASSMLEHPCVIEPLRALERAGHTVIWLPLCEDGTLDPIVVKDAKASLKVVMLVNHETGAIQEVKARADGGAFHCDAAQAVGKLEVRFADLKVTTMSVSSHKFGGPPGIGALLAKSTANLKSMMYGGPQQRGLRPGTESPVLAVGMATALEHALADLDETRERWRQQRREMIERLEAEVPPIRVNGDGVPNTVNVSFLGCRADLLLMSLDLAGVAVSTGSACSSGSLLPSPVLNAMNVGEDALASAIRFSLGRTEIDLDEALERITMCVRGQRRLSGKA